MSLEKGPLGNDDEKETHSISMSEDVYKRLQKYAIENDATLEEAAMHFMKKGTPILKGIYRGVEKRAKERKRAIIQNKRQYKRQG